MKKTAEKVVNRLIELNKKISTAESCTGGLVAKLITDISGASEVFDCSIVSYSNEIKNKLLYVPNELLDNFGAVSAEVAFAMARGIRTVAGADIGVGITGIAGPTGATDKYPVGTCFIAVTDGEKDIVRLIQTDYDSDDCRNYNRNFNAKAALEMTLEILE